MDLLKYNSPWALYEEEIPHSRICDAPSPAEILTPAHLQRLRDAFTSAAHVTRLHRKQRNNNHVHSHMVFEEFSAVLQSVLQSEAEPAWAQRFFDEVDICGSGRLSWQQLSSYLLLEYSHRHQASVPAALHQTRPLIRHCSRNKQEPTVRVVAVFSPPPVRYVSVSKGGQLSVWDKDLRITHTLRLAGDPTEEVAHTKRFRGWVTDAVYMKNARTVAVVTDSRDIHFINVSTARAFQDFHLYGFPSVLTAACYWYNTQYPYESSELLVGDEMGGIHMLRFLTPTKRLFKNSSKKEKCTQRIYLQHLREQQSPVSYCCLQSLLQLPINRMMSAAGPGLVLASSESSVTSLVCIDLSTQQHPYVWKIKDGVKCFDYNEPLQLIVTGGSDGAVRVWPRHVTSCPLATLLGHHAAVIDVAIFQPVEQVFSYSSNVELRIWDVTTQQCLRTVRLHFPCLQETQIPAHSHFPFLLLTPPLPDDMKPHLVVGCRDHLALLSLSERHRGGGLTDAPPDPLSCALYNPALQQVVTASRGSTVCVWDLETGKKKVHISNAHGEEELSCMTLDSSQRRLLTGAQNGTIKVWNLLNGLNLHKLEPLSTAVTGLLCLHNNHIFAVGSSQYIVQYDLVPKDFQVKSDRSWKLSGLHKSDIVALAPCPALDVIATATQRGEVVVWKLETHMALVSLCGAGDTPVKDRTPVDCLIFLQHRASNKHLRQKAVLVSSQAGWVRFWSITGHKRPYGEFFAPEQLDESVLSLSSDQAQNSLLVCGDTAGCLHIWDICQFGLDVPEQSPSPPRLHCWRAHTGPLTSVEVLQTVDGLFMLSASADGSAALWTQDGGRVGSFGRGKITDAKRDRQSSLTGEQRDQSPDPCDSGQTPQRRDFECSDFETEHPRAPTARPLEEGCIPTGDSWGDRRCLFTDSVDI
ncbi:unnamed protein product [Knipowitschia caucasica]|uniref:EF-hand domain-containing protein n=1 Tax=Knipowitschia caucasica TaxID=637954 RepID=A0AAV2LD63_KNICA